MASVVIARGPWTIDTTTITNVVRNGDNSYSFVAVGTGYTVTLAEALQLGINDLTSVPGSPPAVSALSQYKAAIDQAGTAAPTEGAVFGVNQIGAIVWTRSSAGVYVGTLTSLVAAFPANKTFIEATIASGSTGLCVKASRTANTTIEIDVFDAAGAAADLVGRVYIVVQVYP